MNGNLKCQRIFRYTTPVSRDTLGLLLMSKLKITFVGHATFLIELEGEIILTDPNFSKKVLISKRKQEVGIRPEDLPPLSAIVVTHAHYDHLDLLSYKYFSSHTPIVVPRGLGAFLTKHLKNPVIEISPWSAHQVGGTTLHTVPVKHQGFRLCGLTWRGTTGYVLEKNGVTIFFPGDTAYGDHFTKIANLHKIDVALLPIGAYEPRWFMKHRHMNPPEALQALHDLKANVMIPYHWGAFPISAEPLEAPLAWLQTVVTQKPNQAVPILQPGESYSL